MRKLEGIRVLLLLLAVPFYSLQSQDPGTSAGFRNLMLSREREGLRFTITPPDSFLITQAWKGKDLVPLRTIRIIAVGDIMPGTDYPDQSYLPPSCSALFDPVRSLISGADLAVGNLEGVFSSRGGTPKNCKDPKTCYVFRMPDTYLDCIMDAGFDILGVANNHVNDFGYQGRLNTIDLLTRKGVPFAGFPSHSFTIVESAGLKIGFCAFAPHTGTLDLKDYEAAAALVELLKEKTDLVIVSFHGGAEGRDHQHITGKDEIYLGYNRGNVRYFSQRVIEAGADLVVGHGPHVVRAMEFYQGKLIAYSLGNFCTYRRFNLSGPNAFAPVLEVEIDEYGNLMFGRVHSFLQLGEGGPVPDPAMNAFNRIKDLSGIDFPSTGPVFDQNGTFYPQK